MVAVRPKVEAEDVGAQLAAPGVAPLRLRLPPEWVLTNMKLLELCSLNDTVPFEVDETGALIVGLPSGHTSEWIAMTFVAALHNWMDADSGGLVFGSGWYEPGPSKADLPGYTQALVQRAVDLHESIGRDETLAYYNTPESADGPWYVFVIEDRDGVLYSVANANRPDIVGKTRERIDANGFNYGEAMAAVTEESGGAWVSYLFTHPQTREDAPKHSWVVRVGNLIFGVGWYEGIEYGLQAAVLRVPGRR